MQTRSLITAAFINTPKYNNKAASEEEPKQSGALSSKYPDIMSLYYCI